MRQIHILLRSYHDGPTRLITHVEKVSFDRATVEKEKGKWINQNLVWIETHTVEDLF